MPAFLLKPACKDYLWGGEKLRTDYHIESDCRPLAEAWVLSCQRGRPVRAGGDQAKPARLYKSPSRLPGHRL